jgi:hypothetical protein
MLFVGVGHNLTFSGRVIPALPSVFRLVPRSNLDALGVGQNPDSVSSMRGTETASWK